MKRWIWICDSDEEGKPQSSDRAFVNDVSAGADADKRWDPEGDNDWIWDGNFRVFIKHIEDPEDGREAPDIKRNVVIREIEVDA